MCIHVTVLTSGFCSGIICYDDGCHLRKYTRNPIRSQLSVAATKLASLNIVIDKLHFSGHTDAWCHANCNPYDADDLKEVCMYVQTYTCAKYMYSHRMTGVYHKGYFLCKQRLIKFHTYFVYYFLPQFSLHL